MRARGRVAIDRDQDASPFSAILWRLCEGCAAHATALVDNEGETVDYAGRISPYEIRVAAAELRLVLALAKGAAVPGFAGINEIRIRTPLRSYAIVALGDGYAIVLELLRRSFSLSRRALAQAMRELEFEAAITSVLEPGSARWSRVRVRATRDDARRPEAIWLDSSWQPVTVLGRYRSADLARRERGYLARLANGAEFSLVREPLGYWFMDDLT
ncbi:MAG TPA: hypothetical protein VHV51_05380 [Polyangiaceae bacterium]|jgi:hypothetical protein|nr:hypothetical protein [Polyangiaceae bacterium]